MEVHLPFSILPQPNDTTCGPTCLHAVYSYFGDSISLQQVIEEVPMLEGGGTLAVLLACHALRRGYQARIYTYKLQLFDPTWLCPPGPGLRDKLRAQAAFKDDPRLRLATEGFLEFLDLGGELRFEDLTADLLRKYVRQGAPILTGLSATYLYRTPREYGFNGDFDDVRGEPSGHFVVLCGYNKQTRAVRVADPLLPNPVSHTQIYEVDIRRVICAILLGVLTYDANLLIIRKKKHESSPAQSRPDRGR